MPPRSRRTRRSPAQPGGTRPRPPSGALEQLTQPIPVPDPEPTPPAPPSRPAPAPEVVHLYARFATASAALVFTGQLPGGQPIAAVRCLRGGPGDGWWVRADLTLDAARELTSVTSGQVYLPSDGYVRRDRGWGGASGTGQQVALSDLREVTVLQLVRAAGLRPCPARPLPEAVLLLPGHLASRIASRGLDLNLEVTYRPVALTSLFEPDTFVRTCIELCLRAEQDATLPVSLLAALDRDPLVLLCRRAGDHLLVRHRRVSPLPEQSLAALAGDGTWVLADAGYGCALLRPLGEPQLAAAMVRRGRDHALVGMSPEAGWAEAGNPPAEPTPPELTVVPTRMSGKQVDAALLDDAELRALPSLLAGEPLAEAAVLVRGRDRHLLTAPGGLLEQLPVGEPLYCLGPGSLYLPLGYRTQPRLPAVARRALFPTDAATAIVLLPGAALRYDLGTRTAVWRLWAGQPPPVDYQLPPSAIADLETLDRELAPATAAPSQPRPAQQGVLRRLIGGDRRGSEPRDWRDEAYEAELAGDYTSAAELHVRHNDPLRAARLFERAAER